jgi:Domain of unknown function (DUF4145)
VTCASCGHRSTKHRVLYEKENNMLDEDGEEPYAEYHRLVECMGCETIKYVTSTVDFFDPESKESGLKVYPDAPSTLQRPLAISMDEAIGDDGKALIPESVWKMYKETINALNAGSRTLAAGGLRAMVEGICLNNAIKGRNLQEKIDELAMQNLLTKTQAELLHEERYLGNAALHELATPSNQDIEDGLGIVEGLINTIYILPSKAKRLKERRESKMISQTTTTKPKP